MRRWWFWLVLMFGLYGCSSGLVAGPTSYLPVQHRVYRFLERMEASRQLSGLHLGTKPFTRAKVAEALEELASSAGDMAQADREEYDYLMDEFGPDMEMSRAASEDDRGPLPHVPGFLAEHLYRNRRNLYSNVDPDYSLFLDPVIVRTGGIGPDTVSGEDDDVFVAGNGVRMRGTVGERVGFFVDVRDSKEYGDRAYPADTATTMPGRGFATFKEDHAEFDETHAHITYAQGPFTLTWGRGQHAWGRGASGNLGLSAYSAPVDFLKFEAAYWNLRFVFLTAELEQYPPIAENYYPQTSGAVADSVTVQKRMSAHRLELDLPGRLSLGLYETVIYGGRYEWSYLNPLMFLKGAEHANGDHDNAGMGMDVRWIPGAGYSLYGELFIDDISTTKLGTDWYGNKLAYQAGLFGVDPLGFSDSDVRIEYTRISPWVYTHRYPINTYTHYGDVLGYALGPNADMLMAELSKRFTRRFTVRLTASHTREGENPPGINIGGDPLDGFSDGDSTEASFLAGDVIKTSRIRLLLSYEIARECFLSAGMQHEDIDGDTSERILLAFRLNDWTSY